MSDIFTVGKLLVDVLITEEKTIMLVTGSQGVNI